MLFRSRVQFASRNHPLIGDYKYNTCNIDIDKTAKSCGFDMDMAVKSCNLGRNQIALCATSITLNGKEFNIEAGFNYHAGL